MRFIQTHMMSSGLRQAANNPMELTESRAGARASVAHLER